MTLPANISVSFDFSSGATFGTGFVIGDSQYGILGTSRLGSSPVIIPVVDLTPNVYSIKINRGRNIVKDSFEAGIATIRVLDADSNFNPQNVNSIYYPYLTPLRKIRISATVGSTQTFLFSGYVTDYKYTYPQNQETGYVDITCADAFRLFQMANVQTIAGANTVQTTGTRIGKIFDDTQFPASMRNLAAGDSNVQADPSTVRTTLEAIKNVEFCEQGAFYMDGWGTAQFKSRSQVVGSLAATPIEFNQTTGIPYSDLKFQYDDKLILNDVTFTRIGGTAQNIYSQSSIDKYFPHSLTQSDLVAETDTQVNDMARLYVTTRKETTIRIDEMKVDLLNPSVPTATMIGLDFFNNLRITNVQPDGSTIVKVLQCQGLAWEITANKFMVTVTTLEPIADGFIIGNTFGYGTIGVSTMSY